MQKLCTYKEWQYFYRQDRARRFLIKDIFSRVRGQTGESVTIVKRGGWSKNNIFGRCRHCKGLTVCGICQRCGFLVLCFICKQVVQLDKTTLKMTGLKNNIISHGLCGACADKQRKEFFGNVKN